MINKSEQRRDEERRIVKACEFAMNVLDEDLRRRGAVSIDHHTTRAVLALIKRRAGAIRREVFR